MSWGDTISAGLGMALGKWEDERQVSQQKKLSKQQMQNNKEMTLFNNRQQLQMWKDTNYGAQRKEMEKAGLNVGLMYGMGGGGGASANISTGNVAGATASGSKGEVGQAMQLGLQKQLQEAQIKNIEADTVKKGAETAGVLESTKGTTLNNTWETFLQTVDENEGADGMPLKERGYRTDLNKRTAEIQKLSKELDKMGVDMNKGEAEINRIKSDENLKKQLFEYKEAMNPMELERFKQELEVYGKNPANNEYIQWIKEILGMAGNIVKIGK